MTKIKSNIYLLIALVFSYYLGKYISKQYNNYNKPILKIINNTIDFGIIKKEDIAEHYFIITNIGKSDLTITDVLTKCGCTTPTWYRNTIKSNQKDSILIKYDTNIIGAFTKYVEIESNAYGLNRLYLRGQVIE